MVLGGFSLKCLACNTNILLGHKRLEVTQFYSVLWPLFLLIIFFSYSISYLVYIQLLFNKKANVNKTFPVAIILLCFGVQGGGGSNITLNVSKNIKISCLAPWQVNISLTFAI